MRSRLLVAALVLLAVVSAALATVIVHRLDEAGQPAGAAGGALIGGPFDLASTAGGRATDADFQGRWMLVFFGYTYCPDICPLGLQTMTEAVDELPDAVAGRVVPLFVTIDPERDTLPVMTDYVGLFDAGLIGLTGTPEEIASVTRAYRVYARKADSGSATDYLMDHSTFTYLMGPDGQYVTHFGHGTTAEQMAARITELVGSGS